MAQHDWHPPSPPRPGSKKTLTINKNTLASQINRLEDTMSTVGTTFNDELYTETKEELGVMIQDAMEILVSLKIFTEDL